MSFLHPKHAKIAPETWVFAPENRIFAPKMLKFSPENGEIFTILGCKNLAFRCKNPKTWCKNGAKTVKFSLFLHHTKCKRSEIFTFFAPVFALERAVFGGRKGEGMRTKKGKEWGQKRETIED